MLLENKQYNSTQCSSCLITSFQQRNTVQPTKFSKIRMLNFPDVFYPYYYLTCFLRHHICLNTTCTPNCIGCCYDDDVAMGLL